MWNWNALSQNAAQQNAQTAAPAAQAAAPAPLLLDSNSSKSVSKAAAATARTATPQTALARSSSGTSTATTTTTAPVSQEIAKQDPDAIEEFSRLRITRRTIPAQDVHTELSARKFIPLHRMDAVPRETFTTETVRTAIQCTRVYRLQ